MEALERYGLDPEQITDWVRCIAGEPETPVVLNDKGWSLVIHFGVAVFKVTAENVFQEGAAMFELVGRAAPGLVPQLLDWRTRSGRNEMLFRPFGGVSVESLPVPERKEGLIQMAKTAARVQANVTALKPQGLPTVKAIDVPAMLDELIESTLPVCQFDFAHRWPSECALQNYDGELAEELKTWRPKVKDWAAELEQGGWSNSIDHVDLLPQNAHLFTSGDCVVFDWEQAVLGVPFFSVDVLLAYAQCIDGGEGHLRLLPERSTPTQDRIRSAYLSELPGPIDLALRLSPIRYCWSEWKLATSTGMQRYGVDDVVWWMTRALRRWRKG